MEIQEIIRSNHQSQEWKERVMRTVHGKKKGNGEVSWCGVNGIIVGVHQDIERVN